VGFFDPMGLSAGKSDGVMAHYRESELKHGRVAMAACLGWYITAAGVHPAFNSELSSDPLQAAQDLPFVGWLQFILGCGAIEWLAEQIKTRPGYVPGDVLGASYWVDDSDEGWVDYQNKEINNGRLAMLAFMGILGKFGRKCALSYIIYIYMYWFYSFYQHQTKSNNPFSLSQSLQFKTFPSETTVTRSSSTKQLQLSLLTCTSLPHLDPVEHIATAGDVNCCPKLLGKKAAS
jgi:hypothetical protein